MLARSLSLLLRLTDGSLKMERFVELADVTAMRLGWIIGMPDMIDP